MTYKVNNIDVLDETGYLHESFSGEISPANIAATEVKITASDGASSDFFGGDVAIGSGRIVVGASWDNNSIGTDAGSAYIFDLDGNELAKITASDGVAGDFFGTAVSVGSGRIIVGSNADVGAPDTGAAYVFDLNGNELFKLTLGENENNAYFGVGDVGSNRIVVGATQEDNENGISAGSIHLYDLNGNFISKIISSDTNSGSANFGRSVAVGCGRIIVGAPQEESGSGAAYILDLNGNEIARLAPSDLQSNFRFGEKVDIGCGRIVVGSAGLSSVTNIPGFVYIFDLNGNQLAKITGSDSVDGDLFGDTLSIGSNKIIVGAYQHNSATGAAYLFDLDGNELTKITASDAAASDFFGGSIAVGSGKIVIGARLDDDNGSDSGSAYIYDLGESYDLHLENLIENYGG